MGLRLNMLNDKAYHLYIQRHLKILMIGMLTVFSIIGLLFLSGIFQTAQGDGPPRLVGIVWIGIIGLYSYWVLSLPHTIIVSQSGKVEFMSVLRKRQTTLREIQSIKPDTQYGFLIVRTSSRKIRILNQFDEFHDFLARLKAANPNVKLQGC
jgi:hypothetical protein